jgi:hypothetical protein
MGRRHKRENVKVKGRIRSEDEGKGSKLKVKINRKGKNGALGIYTVSTNHDGARGGGGGLRKIYRNF